MISFCAVELSQYDLPIACNTQVLPKNTAPPPNPLNNRADFWNIMRTSAGWIAVGRLRSSVESAIYHSTDGVNWGSTPVHTFTNGSRASLWQALQNDPQEAVVLASVQSRVDGNWLDIFRSEDGGLS